MSGFRDTGIRDDDPRTEVANLRTEIGVLREVIARNLERAAMDDYNAMTSGREGAHTWESLPDATKAKYRSAVAADFWREA